MSKPFAGVKIVFSTYQSAQVVAEGLPVNAEGQPQPFDLAVFDEAHKTASREGTRFSFALEDANLPIRKRLFFTATPRHYDVRKKDKEGENTLVYSMDKPAVYGPVVHTLSFAEAARRGIICDYKVVISVVTSAMVDDHLLKHGEVNVDGDTVKAKQVALQVALQKAVDKCGVSRIFTFHGSVAAARSFTSDNSEGIRQHLPDFTTLHVSGDMATSRREDQMKAFRQADKAVISNARCLTEGVDVPAVDMVAFISPRKSKVDIVQATGRAMRRSPGKEFGYVMVPLFVEQASNESIEDALKRTGFDDVWDLLGAMKEQDEVLTDIIREMREDKGRTGGYNEGRFAERVDVLGPSVSLETIRGSITAECLERLGVSWDERFGELCAYRVEYGDMDVPSKYPGRLGGWVANQRTAQNNGDLSLDRKFQLDSIGFVWNALDFRWDERFNELLKYKIEYGNVNVPNIWSTGLGQWVATQRQSASIGALTIERRNKLNELAFEWSMRDEWDERYRELIAYKNNFGNVNVKARWPGGLGSWLLYQKKKFVNNEITTDQKNKLVEIGIGIKEKKMLIEWSERYTDLLKYKQKHGHVNVSRADDAGLRNWIGTQRQLEKSGALSIDRKRQLDLVGFPWDSLSEQWNSSYDELVAYKSQYGDVNIPINWHTGLGMWVSVQRRAEKNGKLFPERRAKLNEIGFVWSKSDSQWEDRYKELLAYKAEYGDMLVPQKWTSGLGAWVSQQKLYEKNNQLTKERKNALQEMGFTWENRKPKTDWNERFKELEIYKIEHGDFNVPRSWSTGLGNWVGNQRTAKRMDSLLAERERMLERIGFFSTKNVSEQWK